MYYHALKCGNCNNLVDFDFRRVGDFTPRTPEQIKALSATIRPRRDIGMSVRTVDDDDIVLGFAHSQCPRCYHPALIVYECTRVAHKSLEEMAGDENKGFIIGGASRITIKAIYPTPVEPMQDPLWPGELRRAFADAQTMVAQKMSPSIILATCGTVLELAAKKLDDDDKLGKLKLQQRIDHLHQSGHITSPIKDWAHTMRQVRNGAAHSAEGTDEEAIEYVEFLKMFLNMTFSLPARIEQKRQDTAQQR